MATRSNICYELEDGSVRGVYCHWDGYPENMLPSLSAMEWEEVRDMVEQGLRETGLRSLTGPGRFKTYNDNGPVDPSTTWPPKNPQSFSYLVRRDGSLAWCDGQGNIIEDSAQGVQKD